MTQTIKRSIIYLDQDDDITTILNKMKSAEHKIIALVSTHKTNSLTSAVNMKLIFRGAKKLGKHVHLIATDNHITNLAALAGIAVAPTLKDKPVLRKITDDDELESTSESAIATKQSIEQSVLSQNDLKKERGIVAVKHFQEEELEEDLDSEVSSASFTKSHKMSKSLAHQSINDLEQDDIDQDDEDNLTDSPSAKFSASNDISGKKSLKKSIKIPDFYAFRKKMIWLVAGLASILFILVFIFAQKPSANIELILASQRKTISSDIQLSTDAASSSTVLKAKKRELTKDVTNKVAATGKKNIGTQSSGSLTVTNCSGQDQTLPAGTIFSSGGLNFSSSASVKINDSNYFSQGQGGNCKNDGTAVVQVIAVDGGEASNLSTQNFTISGLPVTIFAKGSTSGGKDDFQVIVAQEDIDALKQKFTSINSNELENELRDQIAPEEVLLDGTFKITTPEIVSKPALGEVATDITATTKVIYSVMVADKTEFKNVIESIVASDVDIQSEDIIDNGMNDYKFKAIENGKYTISTNVSYKPSIDETAIKDSLHNKKSGEAEEVLRQTDNYISSKIKVKPFFKSKIPSDNAKINLTISVKDQEKK